MASRADVSRRSGWQRSGVVLVAWIAGFAMPAWAGSACPWMNEMTASALLGADAKGSYAAASAAQPANCVFEGSGAGVTSTLTITVETSTDWQGRIQELLRDCHGEPRGMQAIGNEAKECEVMLPRKLRGELVVGRVRDQVFSIAIVTTMRNDPVLGPEQLENRIAAAAEQVAGNLY